MNICVVLPCFKVQNKIYSVYKKLIKLKINKIIFVDDCCPQKSIKFLSDKINYKNNKKIQFVYLKKNLGVGGATLTGFNLALKQGYDVVIKFDSDNQHFISDLKNLIKKLKMKNVYFCKGYRSLNIKKTIKTGMPLIRIFGAIMLTYITRIITQNYKVRDVTNGLLGLKTKILKNIKINKIKKNYFFEQDLIFHLSLNKIKIDQIETRVLYANEKSNLSEYKVLIPFIMYHSQNILISLLFKFRKLIKLKFFFK